MAGLRYLQRGGGGINELDEGSRLWSSLMQLSRAVEKPRAPSEGCGDTAASPDRLAELLKDLPALVVRRKVGVDADVVPPDQRVDEATQGTGGHCVVNSGDITQI